MLQITALMLVVDIFSRFDGNVNTFFPIINHISNFLIFLLNPILPSYWLLYAHNQVFREDEKTRRLILPLVAINGINAVLIILTQFFGWFYYIDIDNIYHRGPFFLLAYVFIISLMLGTFIMIIVNRKKVEEKYYFSLIFFAVPPFLCIILHSVFYGISIMLNGVVLSLWIVFLNIQNHNIHTDYLTGVNNRKKLDSYLKEKISASTKDKTFSAIMMDLNNFKFINDKFGHDIGDNALQVSVKLLYSCIKSKDFIARFGGDEFCIVLDVSDRSVLDAIVSRINNCIKNYNESNEQPYEISFSMGYAVYDYHSHMTVEEFQKQIDMLMYENKQ
jgi:diguanylate cyclase (GGDEF)-like protein